MMISKGMTGALPRAKRSGGNGGCILSIVDTNKQTSSNDQGIKCATGCHEIKGKIKVVVEREVVVGCRKEAKINKTEKLEKDVCGNWGFSDICDPGYEAVTVTRETVCEKGKALTKKLKTFVINCIRKQ